MRAQNFPKKYDFLSHDTHVYVSLLWTFKTSDFLMSTINFFSKEGEQFKTKYSFFPAAHPDTRQISKMKRFNAPF